jgi:acyl-CoA hydrolase
MLEINYTTAEEAVKCIQPGNRIFIHGSAATPVCLVRALQKRYTELYDVELISITTLGDKIYIT